MNFGKLKKWQNVATHTLNAEQNQSKETDSYNKVVYLQKLK